MSSPLSGLVHALWGASVALDEACSVANTGGGSAVCGNDSTLRLSGGCSLASRPPGAAYAVGPVGCWGPAAASAPDPSARSLTAAATATTTTHAQATEGATTCASPASHDASTARIISAPPGVGSLLPDPSDSDTGGAWGRGGGGGSTASLDTLRPRCLSLLGGSVVAVGCRLSGSCSEATLCGSGGTGGSAAAGAGLSEGPRCTARSGGGAAPAGVCEGGTHGGSGDASRARVGWAAGCSADDTSMASIMRETVGVELFLGARAVLVGGVNNVSCMIYCRAFMWIFRVELFQGARAVLVGGWGAVPCDV